MIGSRAHNILVVVALSLSPTARAGIDDLVQAIAHSDIRFTLADSYVPFIPIAWANYRHYTETEFVNNVGLGKFREDQANLGAIVPAYVGQRDMVLVGFDAAFSQFDFDTPAVRDANVVTLTPVAGWLRQLDDDSQIGAFVAPLFSSALDDSSEWGAEAFAGVIGSYRANDRLMWIYGGVYEYSFGDHYFYPYVGLRWTPDEHWAVSLVAPWPTIAYAPNENFFINVGVTPGGASWRVNDAGDEAVASFGSWNLSTGAAYRLSGHFWLHAEAGFAGLRSLEINQGDTQLDADLQRQPLFFLALEFRP